MKIEKCKCGRELQLSEVLDNGNSEIYNCSNPDCNYRVIIDNIKN